MRLSALLILISCTSCGQQTTKYAPDKKAVELNNSAINLIRYPSDSSYEKAIILLNQAIKIDSNFFMVYANKFSFWLSLNNLIKHWKQQSK